jgi:alpha-glucosidase (family GH31 glycosyl hydrolase)
MSTPTARAAVVNWDVSPRPFSVSFDAAQRLLTTQAGGLAYVLGDGTRHSTRALVETSHRGATTVYVLATDEPGRTARVALERSRDGVQAAWSVEPSDDVASVRVTLTAGLDQHFLGGGEHTGVVDLQKWIVRLKVWNGCQANAPATSFLSSAGYGVAVDSTSVGSVAFPGAVDGPTFSCQWGTTPCPVLSNVEATQICERGSQLAYSVYGGSFPELQRALTTTTGRPALPPPSELELIKWRDAATGPVDLLDDVQQLRSRGIPIGWELLDNPWESCLGTLTFDPASFPQPGTLIDALHARRVRLMLWVSPLVDPRCGGDKGYDRLVPGDGADLSAIDLTSGASRAELERRLAALLELGVDGFKGDRGDEVDLEHAQLAGGYGQTLHNRYPVLFEQTVADAATAAGQAPLPAIFRAGFTGSAQLVSGFWAGDQTGDVHGLRSAIRSAATAGLGGYSTWGSDIGGYLSESLRPDVFVRWSQLGAISPVFEVGGRGPQSRFWQFGPLTTARFRSSAVLHYELFPFLYGLVRQAHATGIPVLRPLAFGYPDDAAAWKHDLELLVGEDLLAAPVDRTGRTVDFPVYLPRGRWVDVFHGEAHTGGRTIVRTTPLADFPLYLRAGSAIRFNLRAAKVWRRPWQVDELERAGRTGWLYAPGGKTTAGAFRASATPTGVRLQVARRAGAAQVLVLGRRQPASVEIDGRRIASRSDLRHVTAGWRLRLGPMPGVILKLPAGGRATIAWPRR